MVPVVLRRKVRRRRPLVMVMVMVAASATRSASAVRIFARTGGSLTELATCHDPAVVLGGGLVHHRVRTVVLSELAVATSLLWVLGPDDVQIEHLLLL